MWEQHYPSLHRGYGVRPGAQVAAAGARALLEEGAALVFPGAGLEVVDPARRERRGPWTLHHWPDLDEPPHTLVALRVPFDVPAGESYLRNGWQSWSAPTVERLGRGLVRSASPPRPLGGRRHWLAHPPYAGDESYDVLAADGYVAGFAKGGGVLVARPDRRELLAVREQGLAGGHPPVWTAEGDAPALLRDLLQRAGGRVPPVVPVTWCSWEAHREFIDADVIGDELGAAARLRRDGLLDGFLVDDGYQAALGDWTAGPHFPRGLAVLAEEIAAAGLVPGLWTAPLLVSPRSRVAVEHPEWVLRHLDGAPVVPLRRDDHWGGDSWVLDATRRDVREHLAAVAHGHAAMGWRILKLDFLYSTGSIGDVTAERAAAGLPPTGERLSTAEVTRAVYEALRAGAGEDVLLQACGAPLWPAVGLVDIMRVGPDARRHWGPHPLPGIEDAMMRCLGNCWRAARLRADFHDRLWANDPDLVMLRPGRCELTAEQRIGWADWVAASGQALTLSDSFADLGPPERFIWERTVTTWRLTRAGRPRGPRGAAQGVATSTSKAEAMTR